jgi:tyrosine-protein kinase Etk/Wzc
MTTYSNSVVMPGACLECCSRPLFAIELEAMKRELGKIEGGASGPEAAGIAATPEGMDNLRLLRDVKYYETIFDLLAKQFEIAKIDEARDASIVQVLDPAVESERKSKPRRALITIMTALVAGFLAVIWVFIKEAGDRARQDPQQAKRLNLLRRYIRGK